MYMTYPHSYIKEMHMFRFFELIAWTVFKEAVFGSIFYCIVAVINIIGFFFGMKLNISDDLMSNRIFVPYKVKFVD